MKIRIYLKNGTVLPDIECEAFTVSRNKFTGMIDSCECKGAIIPRPLYVDINEIAAVFRTDVPEAEWLGARGEYTCSNCGAEAPKEGRDNSAPYCYNCGLPMKVTEDET